MENVNNFIISEEKTLTKYTGKDSKIIIPDGVKKIDRNVFYNQEFIEEIYIPESIEIIEENNFIECKNLKFNVVDKIKYLGNEKSPYLVLISSDRDIKDAPIQEGCKLIMSNAFNECYNLSKINLPSSVRYIGYMAFYNCNSLSELSFSENIKTIESNAFYDCNIKKLILPKKLEYIGRDSFSIASLEEVTIYSEISYIGSGAFTHNDLKFNEYNNGYYIGSKENPYTCFMRVKEKNISNIEIHKDCKVIYEKAFYNCNKLKCITIPKKVLQVGQEAFKQCLNLKKIVLSKNLSTIDDCAFADCEKLKEIQFPNKQISINCGAFMGCASLKVLELNNATVGDNAFNGCKKLKKLKIGASSNLYGYYIFSDCPSLKEITLPKELESKVTKDEFEDSKKATIKYI